MPLVAAPMIPIRNLLLIATQAAGGSVVPKIESVFKKIAPAVPFDYKFADTEYGLKFAGEERMGNCLLYLLYWRFLFLV